MMFRPDPKPEKTIKEKKPWRWKPKPTGQVLVFEQIWKERPHKSQISGDSLGDEAQAIFFSHILAKGKNQYPQFILNKQNIVLMTADEHHLWEHCKKGLVNNPEWKWVFELQESLKEQYKELYGK